MPPRTRPCSAGVRQERLRKAEEFWRVGRDAMDLADPATDVADAAVTLFVHSGIASSDVICCARLGLFSQGEDHRQAIALLAQADAGSSTHLATLLELKTEDRGRLLARAGEPRRARSRRPRGRAPVDRGP